MTNIVKYWLFKSLNITFRLIIPAITAGIVFGFFKKATGESLSFFSQFQAGSFIILLLFFTEIKDHVKKSFKQFGMDNQLAFLHNNGFLFIIIATILLMVKLYADKAINFFYIAGVSKVIAYIFEIQVAKYYRVLHPSKQDTTYNKLDMLIERLDTDGNEETI